ncbi:hypothetical protein COU77_02875 [Candidatus Peregrinibacteria bacterium CG10_big_fil_rev_8_21_14_0_10_49_16]|nr:MAG: hypothetical protein COW95_02390 [Candidatus Peregrinibacteria bacterium CG22_combo_CG10-13_8_21_14_all_49_11]PIR51979.1 MAG: hypothetical protein COU77_02875 [Candidatus Peregrinibacteria bacterium CG10_big_fil_rev_8_21_14_0_10_49_16]
MAAKNIPTYITAIVSAGILTACTTASSNSTSAIDLHNPLVAKRYYDELVENMVLLTLNKDPLLEDSAANRLIERTRREGLEQARTASMLQLEGKAATLLPMEVFLQGRTLLTKTHLFFSPDTEITPGIDLHVLLTTVVDPRDADFPDATAMDLGLLQNPYGAQTYELAEPIEDLDLIRSVVIWDTALSRLHGFGQLHLP